MAYAKPSEELQKLSPEKPIIEVAQALGPGIQIEDDLKLANEMLQKEKSEHLIVYKNGVAIGILEDWMIWELIGRSSVKSK